MPEPLGAVKEEAVQPRKRGSNRLGDYLSAVGGLVWKDLAAELRSRELLGAMLVFALLVILIFNFALELQVATRKAITSGVLWTTFAFAGTLGLNRSMGMERERGCLDALLLAPVDRSAIYFGKALANLVFLLLVAVIVLPVYSALYGVSLFNAGLVGVIVLGVVGYVAVGTLLSAMSVQTRTRDILLPILLFPVVLPVLVAAVKASNGFLQGWDMAEIMPWINLLIVYDVIFVAVSFMSFEYIVQE
ncbi:MAG: heme exporter protein CcmB [Anaerolineales bacterium]|jgi:heme exporter protein B